MDGHTDFLYYIKIFLTGNQKIMNIINPFPHVSPSPGPMGNQTPTRLSDLFQNRHQASCKPSSGYQLLIASAFGNFQPGRFDGALRFMFMWMIFSGAPFASSGHSCVGPRQSSPGQRIGAPLLQWKHDWNVAAILLWKRLSFIPASERKFSDLKDVCQRTVRFCCRFL